MKSFWSLIPRSLIKNKKRTLFISVSIMLSAMLITTMSITISNYKKQTIENAKMQSGGHYYGSCFEAGNFESIKTLKSEPSVDEFGTSIMMGYAEVGSDNYKIELNGYDNVDTELLDFKLEEGRYPNKDSEIALEKYVLDKFNVKPKIGDKIKLSYMFNYINFKDGKESPAVKRGDKEFVLVGILHNRMDSMKERKAKGYLTIDSVKNTLSEDAYRYNHHFTLKAFYNIKETFNSMCEIQGAFINENYSYINALESAKKMNFIFIFLNIIILIAAVSVIYNIYSISVVERMREFGLLRAIGADAEQIQKILFGEGIILGFIAVPLGILLGVLSVNEISALFYKSNSLGISSILKDKAEIPLWGIVVSLVVCFIAIFISIYFPAKKASKISPMEAISNTSVQGEQLENSKGNKKAKIFGKFTTSMAYTNLTRNKKRFMATVISFSISIILFIAVTSITVWVDPLKMVDLYINSDYILTLNCHEKNIGYDSKTIDEILKMKGIESLKKNLYFRGIFELSGDKVTEAYKESVKKRALESSREDLLIKSDIYEYEIAIYGANDEELKELNKYLENGKIDTEDMKKNNKIIFIQNQSNIKNTNLNVADKITMGIAMHEEDGWKHYNKDVEIGALLNKAPFPTSDYRIDAVAIFPEEVLKEWIKEDKYRMLRINTKEDADEDYIKNKLNEYSKQQIEGEVISYTEMLDYFKSTQRSISIVLYSFVIVIALIGIVNIINTISMNIILRRQEFGMIRAIGMGNDEIRSMILKEGLLYGVFSTILGSIMGVLLHILLYKVLKCDKAVQWFFPWKSILEVFLASMVICVLASIGPLKRLLSTSIIESIRNVE
jgi:putative ABC transport system permease protein